MAVKARIIAADSMGIRSIATVVEACGYTVGIDLGASIAPRRYSLPPHPRELKRLEEALEASRRWILESHVVVVTHYHYDHYMRDEPDLYRGKTLLVKDIGRDINRSQAIRGYRFLVKSGLRDSARVLPSDGRQFDFGPLRIELSRPVWHGEEGTRLGKVLMARVICEGEALIFASDVQGPASSEALASLLEWATPRPRLLVISGPPTYLSGYRVSAGSVEKGLEGLKRLIADVRPETLVVDHHFARDKGFMGVVEELRSLAREAGLPVRVVTAAEYMGRPLEPLEALRRELWKGEG